MINEKIISFEKSNSKFDSIVSNKKTLSILKPEHHQISSALDDLRYYHQMRFSKTATEGAPSSSNPTHNMILNMQTGVASDESNGNKI